MSHFLLAVITDQRPDEEILQSILEPYCESEGNPNSKWDWWSIGGRWLGSLLVKPGVTDYIIGVPGAFDNVAPDEAVDGARITDLDLPLMLEKARLDCAQQWDAAEEKRKSGQAHPWMINTLEVGRDDYINQATAFTPFAYVLNGEWHERGEMGWFGQTRNEISINDWDAEFASMLAAQPGSHWITVVDCHI